MYVAPWYGLGLGISGWGEVQSLSNWLTRQFDVTKHRKEFDNLQCGDSNQLLGTDDINGDSNDDDVDDGGLVKYRVGVVTDVDLGIVSKTLVARGLVSYPSGTLR